MDQTEIENLVEILNVETGAPQNFGFARRPLYAFHKDDLRVSPRFLTELDRYCFFSPASLFLLEVEDSGFVGAVRVTVISLRDKSVQHYEFNQSLTMGAFDMPQGSEKGTVRLEQKRGLIEFSTMTRGARVLKVDIPPTSEAKGLRGCVVFLEPQDAQSLVTVLPFQGEKYAFQYTRLSPWYDVEGVMQSEGQEVVFTRGNAFGIFDWERISRPKKDIHYSANAAGLFKKRRVGVSVSYGGADSGPATENAFFIDGKMHKLSHVTFHIQTSGLTLPWEFTSDDRRLEMTFTPILQNRANSRFLFHSTSRRLLFGYFSGRFILDDMTNFTFTNITGYAEKRQTRY